MSFETPMPGALRRLFVLWLLIQSGWLGAQQLSPDEVLTLAIYSDNFGSLPGAPAQQIAAALNGQSLQQMVDGNLIRRADMAGLALPLGIFKYPGPVDLRRGMVQMWDAKARFAEQRQLLLHPFLMRTALRLSVDLQEPGYTMSLRDYREIVLTRVVTKVQRLHQKLQPDYSPERRAFMDLMVANFSANVMLGYNIQELIPPYHFVPPREERINPLFKAYYLDRLLREGGASYLTGFPARYDTLISFGPFQLTQRALDDLQANTRLHDGFRTYRHMRELETLDDHAEAAAYFAYNNLERLSMSLKNDGVLERLTAHFSASEEDADLRRELQIFLAGVIACMHHQPGRTRSQVRAYLQAHELLDDIYIAPMATGGGVPQLEKYYDSAARAYLIMKVYHELIPD